MDSNVRIRNHFSYVIFSNFGICTFIFYALAAKLLEMLGVLEVENDSPKTGTVLLILLAVLVIKMIYEILVWRKTYVYFDENAVVMEKNTLNNKKVTISLKNIANVNVDRNLLGAIIGVHKVKIDTNSSGTVGTPELIVYLKKDKALEFQQAIINRLNGDALKYEDEKRCEKSGIKNSIVHCLLSGDFSAGLLVVFVIMLIMVIVANVDEAMALITSLIIMISGSVGLLILSYLSYVIKSVLSYYGFDSYRDGDNIVISYGLLNKKLYRISIKKISAIKIIKTPVCRLFHKEYVEVVCAGVGDEEKEKSLLLLADTHANITARLKEMLPELYEESEEITPYERVKSLYNVYMLIYFIASMVIVSFMAILFDIRITIITIVGLLIIGVYYYISCNLKYKESYLELDTEKLIVYLGGYTLIKTILPYDKIENMEIEKGPVLKAFKMNKATFHIKAGSILSSIIVTPVFMQKDLNRLVDRYKGLN